MRQNILKGPRNSKLSRKDVISPRIAFLCVNAKSKSTWFSNLSILFVSSVYFPINDAYSWSRYFWRIFFISDLFLDTSILRFSAKEFSSRRTPYPYNHAASDSNRRECAHCCCWGWFWVHMRVPDCLEPSLKSEIWIFVLFFDTSILRFSVKGVL